MAQQFPSAERPTRPVTPPTPILPTPVTGTPTARSSVGTILSDLVENTQHLAKQQVALVQAEVTERAQEEVKTKGVGIALMAAGGIFALFALGFLGWVLIFGFQEWFGLSGWLSALLVTLIYLIIGGILAFVGKNRLSAPSDEPSPTP